MTKETKNIREFIYVDVPKLFSLYSQVFGRVTERVVEERLNKIITGETQRSFIKQAEADSQTLEASRKIESGILHDHMYNKLEKEIESTIIDASKINEEDIKQKLSEHQIIKISGRAEIEDYERINIFFKEFNELGAAIAYSIISNNPEFTDQIKEIGKKLSSSSGKRRKEIESQLDELKDANKIAEKLGLSQDSTLLKNLKFIGELFNPNGYNVIITNLNIPDVHYRGVLDRTWLRVGPELIRQLYGGQSEFSWCMVGAVTHIQGTYINLIKDEKGISMESNPTEIDPNVSPMMLDAYRNLFRHSRLFERAFLESKIETEIIVSPIAIYREFQI